MIIDSNPTLRVRRANRIFLTAVVQMASECVAAARDSFDLDEASAVRLSSLSSEDVPAIVDKFSGVCTFLPSPLLAAHLEWRWSASRAAASAHERSLTLGPTARLSLSLLQGLYGCALVDGQQACYTYELSMPFVDRLAQCDFEDLLHASQLGGEKCLFVARPGLGELVALPDALCPVLAATRRRGATSLSLAA